MLIDYDMYSIPNTVIKLSIFDVFMVFESFNFLRLIMIFLKLSQHSHYSY